VQEGDRGCAEPAAGPLDKRPSVCRRNNVCCEPHENLQPPVGGDSSVTSTHRQLQGRRYGRGDLENRELRFDRSAGKPAEARDELVKVEAESGQTTVLTADRRTDAAAAGRGRQRPGDAGILSSAPATGWKRLAEVLKSDINRIQVVNRPQFTSEERRISAATLNAKVIRISPQVPSTGRALPDPTGDAGRPGVEVRA